MQLAIKKLWWRLTARKRFRCRYKWGNVTYPMMYEQAIELAQTFGGTVETIPNDWPD